MSLRERADSRPTLYMTGNHAIANRRQISLREAILPVLVACVPSWIKLYNSWFNQNTVNLVLLASKGTQKSHFPFIWTTISLRWRASSRREFYQDYQWRVKFSRYVFANSVRYIYIYIYTSKWTTQIMSGWTFNTELFRRPPKRWPTPQLNSILH